MPGISSRQYHILADHMAIYRFMTEIYEWDWRNGAPAPFLEYALSSDWMDTSFTHRWRIWEDDGCIIGFCFTESPVTDIYFSLRPGYESIADEMITWADKYMPGDHAARRFVLFAGQQALISAAEHAGYGQTGSDTHYQFFFDAPLDYPLPSGFRFTEPGGISVEKACECCWKGFDHETEEGPWNGDAEYGYHLCSAPHATPEYAIAIENARGEYVCYAGMWWTPENRLAYMEPLCTVPEYRGQGLASAILSELARRMRSLGAAQMTGGCNPFYTKIGFKPADVWTYWKKA